MGNTYVPEKISCNDCPIFGYRILSVTPDCGLGVQIHYKYGNNIPTWYSEDCPLYKIVLKNGNKIIPKILN